MTMKHRAVHNPRPRIQIMPEEKINRLLHGSDKPPSGPLSAGAVEARRLIAEAQQKYAQQQEKAMNEVKTHHANVQAALDAWGDDDDSLSTPKPEPTKPKGRRLFPVINGVTQRAFEYIRDNPYTTTAQACNALAHLGFKRSSTTSIFAQMLRQGLLGKDKDGRLTTLVTTFRPLKSSAYMAKKEKAEVAAKKAKEKRLAALSEKLTVRLQSPPPQPSPPPPSTPKVIIDVQAIKNRHAASGGITALNATPTATPAQPLTAKQVLETLSVKEAHALYRELQTMFG